MIGATCLNSAMSRKHSTGRPSSIRSIFPSRPAKWSCCWARAAAARRRSCAWWPGWFRPPSGQITVDSLPLSDQTVGAVRRKLGYVIQEGGLFPHLTGVENVTLMARHEGWPRQRIDERLAELVEMTQFPQSGLSRYPNELSGGQRQRLSLMRALFLEPAAFCCSTNRWRARSFDPRRIAARPEGSVSRGAGATVLLVTHDLVEASRLADRVCVMNAGVHRAAGAVCRDSRKADRRIRPRIRQFAGCRAVKNRSLVKDRAHGLVLVLLVAGLAPLPRQRCKCGSDRRNSPSRSFWAKCCGCWPKRPGSRWSTIVSSAARGSCSTRWRPAKSTSIPSTPARSPRRFSPARSVADEAAMRDLLRPKGNRHFQVARFQQHVCPGAHREAGRGAGNLARSPISSDCPSCDSR